jgi:hypothetical protein
MQLREDFAVLRKALTTLHPGLYRYNTPAAWEKTLAGFAARLHKPLDEGEFFLLVSQLTAQIYCGHTYPNPYNQNSALRERLFNGHTYLPFYFQIVEGKMIVTAEATPGGIARGSEITRINGVPVKQIFARLLTVSKSDGRNTPAHRLKSLELTRAEAERYALFDWYLPLFYPLKDSAFILEINDFATKKRLRLRVPAMTKAERTAAIAQRYGPAPAYDDGWEFALREDSTAYLKIENFITWRLKKIKFKEFFADAFAAMRANRVKRLILDLRGNGGGDMEPGFELSRYLAQKPLAPYAASRRLVRNVAAQPDLLKYLDTYDDTLKAVLQKGLPANLYRPAENSLFEIPPNENTTSYPPVIPYENSFTGQTYILAEADNASATFQFLQYAQANKLGVIVGQPTGGNLQGVNGGSYLFLSLPNSQIEIDLPVYFQAPAQPQKDSGVVPDVPVSPKVADIGNGYDRQLETAKKLPALP